MNRRHSIGASQAVYDNPLQLKGIDRTGFAEHHVAAGRDQNGVGQGALPFRIQGIGQGIVIVRSKM